MRIIFFVLGEKGYRVINDFVSSFGSAAVYAVVVAKDKNIKNDFYHEIKSLCTQNGINVFDRASYIFGLFPEKLYKFAIGWRWMLDECNLIIFHDSLLPKYRGFAPLVAALINGDKHVGVTAIHASDNYDKGDIISQHSIKIDYPITIKRAIELVSEVYSYLIRETYCYLLNKKKLPEIKQIEENATYSLWRDEKDYFINWGDSAQKIKRFCDTVGDPYSGAKTHLNGILITINDVVVMPDVNVELRFENIGKIIFFDEGLPVVVCGVGLLKIMKLESEEICSLSTLGFRSRFS